VNRRDALTHARAILAENSIEDSSLEGEILLRHILGIDRARLFADLDANVSQEQEALLDECLRRRMRGEPSAYITGHREFYGLDFKVDHTVLIPRPETELLVETALDISRRSRITEIADVGTGCGAIAVSLAVHLPDVIIYAIDISAPALEVAASNCSMHGVTGRVRLLPGDMLAPLPGPVDLIIANLPYVRVAELPGNGDLSYEPTLALDGGDDGLDSIKKLGRRVPDMLRPGGCLLLEVGQGQAEEVAGFFRSNCSPCRIDVYKDLAGIERVLCVGLT